MGDDMLSVLRATRPVPDPEELDDVTLARAIAGERAASRALVEKYQHRVFALIARMVTGRGRGVVEDLAQDTFLAVFRNLGKFRADGPARLSTWILTIAARRSIDELRRRRPDPVAKLEPAGASRADDNVSRREIATAIELALADLSPELRAAFLLRELHGLEYAEIAESLGIEIGTVKSRLSRARIALRERLAEVHDV
jgi:RNA polymerase sigma-70 factor (ECF subfamily)